MLVERRSQGRGQRLLGNLCVCVWKMCFYIIYIIWVMGYELWGYGEKYVATSTCNFASKFPNFCPISSPIDFSNILMNASLYSIMMNKKRWFPKLDPFLRVHYTIWRWREIRQKKQIWNANCC
jgi:hypothetical protein